MTIGSIPRPSFGGLVYFVLGLILGYATRAYYFPPPSVSLGRRRDKRTNSSDSLSKDVFEYEIRKLYSVLETIQKQLIEDSHARSRTASVVSDDEIDQSAQAELFFDTSEILMVAPDDSSGAQNGGLSDFQQVDQWFEDPEIDKLSIYDFLRERSEKYLDDPEFLWRYAKAAHFLSKTSTYQNDREKRKQILLEAHRWASKALEKDQSNGDCHKWFAITVGCLSEYVSIKEKIQNGIKFKEHLEIAMKIKPQDPTLYYLAGRFCLELLNISWAERKLAAMLFGGTIPEVTHKDALDYFLKAHQLKPSWKENILYVAKTYLVMKDRNNAAKFVQLGLRIPVNQDQDIHQQLEKLSQTLG